MTTRSTRWCRAPPRCCSRCPKGHPASAAAVAPTRELDREKKRIEHEARVTRWKAIAEAGGDRPWVRAELVAKNLSTEHLTRPTMSGKEARALQKSRRTRPSSAARCAAFAWQAWQATHITHLGTAVHSG